MWYLLSFLILLLLIAGYVIYNLLKKVEQYEDDIQNKDEFLRSVKNLSDQSYKKLKELDSLEAFESDDETGHFFSNLKNIIVTLDAYFKNYTK
jgi:CHASE3 domain sensor protein